MSTVNPFIELSADQRRELARAIQVAEQIAIEVDDINTFMVEARSQDYNLESEIEKLTFPSDYTKESFLQTLASKYTLLSDHTEYGGVVSRDEGASAALRAYIAMIEDAERGEPQALQALYEARISIHPEVRDLIKSTPQSPALGEVLRELYQQEGLGRRRIAGAHVDTFMSLEELKVVAEQLRKIMDGSGSKLASNERHEIVQFAIASQRPGESAALSAHNLLSREIASSLAAIDGPHADNPFAGTGLERAYASAQRWQLHLQERMSIQPTLQDLLNQRAVLIGNLETASTAMHQAQTEELDLFTKQAASGNGREDHQEALLRANGTVKTFSDALRVLREFRHHPTEDTRLLKVFQEVEALELVVNKTESGIRDMQRAGVEPSTDDWADLRNVQLSLKAFLQANNATLPVRNAATAPTPRMDVDDQHKPTPRNPTPRQ
jgi:hypothetical protein